MILKEIWQGWKNLILDKISDIKYKEYFDKRYEICKVCQDNHDGICQLCFCVIKAKTKAEDSRCPVDKWGTIEEILENGGRV